MRISWLLIIADCLGKTHLHGRGDVLQAVMAMIEKTQRRLRQARFFYEHLLNPPSVMLPLSGGISEAFSSYFNAFIQAASVTWTLENEETEKWKEWEPKWRARRTTEEQRLLKIANKFRIGVSS